MPAIEIRGLTKAFGDCPVLQQLDLQLDEIGRLAIIGPSGAGKSTLLRLIAGLEKGDAGQIRVDGVDITPLRPDHRQLALMSQEYALYPQLSVRKNLEAALLSLRLTRQELSDRCDETIHWFGINHLSSRLPSQLSGGQAQRVALAKALIRRPRLLLLDEPFSQLDGPLRNELRELTQHIVEHFGTALMFVTHDPLDAMRMATAIAILRGGVIEQLGTPTEVYRSPRSQAAAEMLSPWGMNWIPPSLLGSQELEGTGGQWREALEAGQLLGFRPEASKLESPIAAERSALEAGDLRWPVTVQSATFVGAGYLTCVRVGEHEMRCLSSQQFAPGLTGALTVGEQALLSIVERPAASHNSA